MADFSHLNALEHRLHNEHGYMAAAPTRRERDLRAVWIAQIEREIAEEKTLLGITRATDEELSDDELLAALRRAA